MIKNIFNNIDDASNYIESIFPFRGNRISAHFYDSHVSNRGKEAYEFNVKCCIKTADWVGSSEYSSQLEIELTDYVYELKERFNWIEECFTAGRSGGWLVITTHDRVFEDWENSDFYMLNEEEIIQRANHLYTIENEIKEKINFLENMTDKEAEEYWYWCKPSDWEKILREKQIYEEKQQEERSKRIEEVINYHPEKFYYLETSHRKYVLNDRGDIIKTLDKMKRFDNWHSYGRVPDKNPLLGWNRIKYFSEDGIAPRTVLFKDAKNKNISGLYLVVYNAPTGNLEYHSSETVESMLPINKEQLKNYNIKKME